MNEPVSVARQATFNTDPVEDSPVTDGSIRRGNIQLPVVTDNLDAGDKLNSVESSSFSGKQQLQPSLTSSTRSSPIYASGGPSFKEFRADVLKNARPSRAPVLGLQPNRPASLGGDTASELDILSDVGLAGDSDTDAPPPSGLSLSLSARRKLPKGEPRIKIASAKTDNAEPTIHEETTQDVLKLNFDEEENVCPDVIEERETLSPQLLSRRPSVRSETIVLDSNPQKKKIVSFNLDLDVTTVTPRQTALTEEEKFIQEISKKAAHLAAVGPARANSYPAAQQENAEATKTYPVVTKVDHGHESQAPLQESPDSDAEETQFNNSLDSSFYESDWQPRESSTSVKSPRKTDFEETDKAQPLELDKNFDCAAEQTNDLELASETKAEQILDNSTAYGDGVRADNLKEQRERQADTKLISQKYETKIKPVIYSRLDAGKRWAKNSNNDERNHNSKLKEGEIDGSLSRSSTTNPKVEDEEREQRKSPKLPTPGDTDTGLTSDWNSEGSSGIPKSRTSPSGTAPVQLHRTSPSGSKQSNTQAASAAQTKANMASSDAYGYESETFEEILKDRNDLVKAEKTYQRRIRQLEEELKGMVNQCQMLSDENKELRQKLDEVKRSRDPVGPVPNSDHVELASRVARLETEKENLSIKNEQLNAKLKDTEAKTKQFESVFVENTKLKTKNVELERKTATLSKEVQQLSNRVQDSETETEGKIQNAHKSNRELQVLVSDLKDENKALKSRITSKDGEIAGLASALDEKRAEVNEMLKAMKNETTTEVELRESHGRLEKAQEEIDNVKKEMELIKQMLKDSEENKSKLQKNLNQKDAEAKKLKADHESKEKMVSELRSYLDRSKLEMRRLEESQSAYREMEKDSSYLKSRIASLKAEIESSISENLRLKQEREDMVSELDRLRVDASHTGEAMLESKKYFRKWENERDARNRVEVELGKKDDDIHVLENRLKEAANQLNSVYAKLKSAEDERAQLANTNIQELSVNNKILLGENKKLRQMLVERNIELTHKNAEQNVFDSRIKMLERKQKDAEVRVKQLSGWVVKAEVTKISTEDNVPGKQHSQNGQQNHHQRRQNPSDVGSSSKSSPSEKASLPPRPQHANNDNPRQHARVAAEPRQVSRHFSDKSVLGVTEPKVAFVSPRARPKGQRLGPPNAMTPPPEWDEPRKRAIDRESGANHTPLSLPSILDSSTVTPPDPHGGYFMLYKERVKRMHDRRF
ncbi:hypothetical protein RRG08_064660 [Elysia crispata]|uniref:Uncharacterized protein n=1 Tax=Elysia crispata TaxID=231223 RepID=A0AAE1ECN8_9GAST|nr:hypothetical protein RRG08_064660 [Elysia crispata]